MTHLLAAAALVIQMTNVSGAPPAIVQAAQDEVTRLYADIGVPLEWSERQPSIRIILLPYETGDLRLSEKQVMGASVRTAGGNLVAYAFYHRVRDLAHRYDVSTEQVLACAIAHELGHLLLPVRGHSRRRSDARLLEPQRVSARRTGAAEVFGRRDRRDSSGARCAG